MDGATATDVAKEEATTLEDPAVEDAKEDSSTLEGTATEGTTGSSSFRALFLIGVVAAICAAFITSIPHMMKPCVASKPAEAQQHAVACSPQWLPVFLAVSFQPPSLGEKEHLMDISSTKFSGWYHQFSEDMKPFHGGISRARTEEARDFVSLMSFGGGLLISIRANQIYYEKLGKVEGFENFLLMITKASMCNYLPDVDIVWKMEDHCGNITAKDGSILPIFSWNKRVTEQCVLFPWVQFLWPQQKGGRRKRGDEWHTREPRLVFRGSTTGGPASSYTLKGWESQHRSKLILACRSGSPRMRTICDAGFTSFPQSEPGVRAMIAAANLTAPPLSAREQQHFRFQALIDGNGAAASRSLNALGSGSTVLFFESQYIEFWYRDLRPWLHYVPVSLDDIETKLELVLHDDSLSQSIAERSFAYVHSISDIDVSFYIHALMRSYSTLQTEHVDINIMQRYNPSMSVMNYLKSNVDAAFIEHCVKH
jgi:protein glucosyltransferase